MRFAGNRKLAAGIALLALFFALASQPAFAGAVRNLTLSNGGTLPANDDNYTVTAQPLGFSINFFGTTYTSCYINNNGMISFGEGTGEFVPEGLQTYSVPTIAAFWSDVDTRAPGSGLVNWGQTTINGHAAFVVNWPHVGQYNQNGTTLNTFQIVLIQRSDTGTGNFDIELNYDQILWDHGGAGAGYTNGATPPTFYEVPGSDVSGAFVAGGRYDLVATNGGNFTFQARNGAVIPATPVPPSLWLITAGLMAFGFWRLRRRRA